MKARLRQLGTGTFTRVRTRRSQLLLVTAGSIAPNLFVGLSDLSDGAGTLAVLVSACMGLVGAVAVTHRSRLSSAALPVAVFVALCFVVTTTSGAMVLFSGHGLAAFVTLGIAAVCFVWLPAVAAGHDLVYGLKHSIELVRDAWGFIAFGALVSLTLLVVGILALDRAYATESIDDVTFVTLDAALRALVWVGTGVVQAEVYDLLGGRPNG